jgi:hypothetical protein
MPASELDRVVTELEEIVESAAADPRMSAPDLRRVLSFLAKVAQVVDQAFQDVYSLLIDLKYLSEEDLNSGRATELRKQLDMILARSRYRDAEETCSRLFHLREQAEDQLRPLIEGLGHSDRWWRVLTLVEEREGRIIMLVQGTVHSLSDLLRNVGSRNLDELNAVAADKAEEIRRALIDLRSVSNEIFGLSGSDGLLELTADRQQLARRANLFINKGTFTMSRDTYSAGQAGAMGPGARAHDMTFQQIWNQAAPDLDLAKLETELTALRGAMRAEAREPEHDLAIGEVAAAQKAAKEGDGPGALKHLRAAGKWALDVASKIGVGVATAALKTSLGL